MQQALSAVMLLEQQPCSQGTVIPPVPRLGMHRSGCRTRWNIQQRFPPHLQQKPHLEVQGGLTGRLDCNGGLGADPDSPRQSKLIQPDEAVSLTRQAGPAGFVIAWGSEASLNSQNLLPHIL